MLHNAFNMEILRDAWNMRLKWKDLLYKLQKYFSGINTHCPIILHPESVVLYLQYLRFSYKLLKLFCQSQQSFRLRKAIPLNESL